MFCRLRRSQSVPRARPGTLGAVLLESAASSGLPLDTEPSQRTHGASMDFDHFLSRQQAFLQVRLAHIERTQEQCTQR